MHGTDRLVGGARRADFIAGEPGDAEVGHLDGAVGQQHDILRLDVPMDDPLVVSVLKRPQNLHGEMNGFLPLDIPLLLDILLEGDAVDVFHDNILQPLPKADVIHLDDVGVGQDGYRLGFVFKPAGEFLVGQVLIPQDFHRHGAIVDAVIGLVHIGHAADTDDLLDFIPTVQPLSHILIQNKVTPILSLEGMLQNGILQRLWKNARGRERRPLLPVS